MCDACVCKSLYVTALTCIKTSSTWRPAFSFYHHVSGHKHTGAYLQLTWSERRVLKFSSLLINEIGQITVV